MEEEVEKSHAKDLQARGGTRGEQVVDGQGAEVGARQIWGDGPADQELLLDLEGETREQDSFGEGKVLKKTCWYSKLGWIKVQGITYRTLKW